ncbi:uncharacterized protein LOC108601554 [Drosophila busckii]|uniref:uncharacterized protein LOC108601554 n=1 Tax=Drosophila busckii TaxID=30019 RepID=UPI00083EC172|nr:uncharacterized protein LOC108601554 [Drosophila busckii]
MKRHWNIDCLVDELQFEGMPMLRLDEKTPLDAKVQFNSEMLALVCMHDASDDELLTALARIMHRMRETRIIILLSSLSAAHTKQQLYAIREIASEQNFVNLLVLQVTTNETNWFRLQPFPQAILIPSAETIDGLVFPNVYRNFRRKIGKTLFLQNPPHSFVYTNSQTANFSVSKALSLGLQQFDFQTSFFLMKRNPFHSNLEFGISLGITNLFIVVPCGQRVSIAGTFAGLKVYLLVGLTIRTFRFSYTLCFFNLPAFGGILGHQIPLRSHRASVTLRQLILLICFYSMVFNTFFNAKLSSLLTRRHQYRPIQDFVELKNSGTPVIFNEGLKEFLESQLDAHYFDNVIRNAVFLASIKRRELLYALNTSNAYQLFSAAWP